MQSGNRTWWAVAILGLIAALMATASPAGAANNNPPFEGFSPPGQYTLEVNGSSAAQVVRDGDILTFDLTQHSYNTCTEGPTTPGCLSNMMWNPWFNRTYVAPFGTGDTWGFTYAILDPDNDCGFDSYTCTVQLSTTRTVPCTGLPYIGNIAPLLMQVQGDLGLGFGSSTTPYIKLPNLYLDLGAPDCQPVAGFSWANQSLDPLEIDFDAIDSYDPDNLDLGNPTNPVDPGDGIVAWSWDFGDGAISFEPDPGHRYNEPGEYEVSLTVTDDEGDTAMAIETILVAGEVIADFTWSYPDDNDRLTIEFDGTLSESSGELLFWEWDFGDDEFEFDQPIVQHTYGEFGLVDVTLYITDEFDGEDQITVTVDVGADPPVDVFPIISSPFGFQYDEGNDGDATVAVIPVDLSAPADTDVFVSWQTVEFGGDPNAATPGADYAADSDTIRIPAGDLQGSVFVTILGDDIDEVDQSAWIEFTSATGAILPNNTFGFVEIRDDDEQPTIRPRAAGILEGDEGTSILDVPIQLDAPSEKTITVDVVTRPDGVLMGGAQDFVPLSETLIFAPGETEQIVSVTVNGDTDVEPGLLFGAEWGAVLVTDATNATIPPAWEKVGFFLIIDDDIAVA